MSLGIDQLTRVMANQATLIGEKVGESLKEAKAPPPPLTTNDKGLTLVNIAYEMEEVAKANKAKMDPLIKQRDESTDVYEALKELNEYATNLKDSVANFNMFGSVFPAATTDSTLEGVSATASLAASLATHTLCVKQIAEVSNWSIEGLNGSVASPFTSKTTSVVNATGDPATILAGTFTITQGQAGDTTSTTITLANGDTLESIADSCNALCRAAGITVKAKVDQYSDSGYYRLSFSAPEGADNAFTITPGTANMFDKVKSAPSAGVTTVARIYGDCNGANGFADGVALPGITAGTNVKLNGTTIYMQTIRDGYNGLADIAAYFNAVTEDTKVVAEVKVAAGGGKMIELTRTEYLASGIDLAVSTTSAATSFCSPKLIRYETDSRAIVMLDKNPFYSSTNTFATLPDISSLTVTKPTTKDGELVEGTLTISTSAKWGDNIRGWVSTINGIYDFVKDQNTLDADNNIVTPLFSRGELTRLTGLISGLLGVRSTLENATIHSIKDMGITVNDATGKLEINDETLDAILASPSKIEEVTALFCGFVRGTSMVASRGGAHGVWNGALNNTYTGAVWNDTDAAGIIDLDYIGHPNTYTGSIGSLTINRTGAFTYTVSGASATGVAIAGIAVATDGFDSEGRQKLWITATNPTFNIEYTVSPNLEIGDSDVMTEIDYTPAGASVVGNTAKLKLLDADGTFTQTDFDIVVSLGPDEESLVAYAYCNGEAYALVVDQSSLKAATLTGQAGSIFEGIKIYYAATEALESGHHNVFCDVVFQKGMYTSQHGSANQYVTGMKTTIDNAMKDLQAIKVKLDEANKRGDDDISKKALEVQFANLQLEMMEMTLKLISQMLEEK